MCGDMLNTQNVLVYLKFELKWASCFSSAARPQQPSSPVGVSGCHLIIRCKVLRTHPLKDPDLGVFVWIDR